MGLHCDTRGIRVRAGGEAGRGWVATRDLPAKSYVLFERRLSQWNARSLHRAMTTKRDKRVAVAKTLTTKGGVRPKARAPITLARCLDVLSINALHGDGVYSIWLLPIMLATQTVSL